MNEKQLTSRVFELVAVHTICRPDQLALESRIGEDLYIIGDDAEELLMDLSSEFNIDLSDFDFESYFPVEGSANMHFYMATVTKRKFRNPIAAVLIFIDSIFWGLFARKKTYKTLTISDLIRMASHEK